MTVHAASRTLDLALGELGALADVLTGLADGDWSRPTALGNWQVVDLAGHVAEIAWRQAEAFHRYRLATSDAPAPAAVTADRSQLPGLVATATDHLRAATRNDFEESPAVPLPFAPLPASRHCICRDARGKISFVLRNHPRLYSRFLFP